MNILVLYIYNETENYKKMLDIQQNYIKDIDINNLNIEYFFITYRDNNIDEVEIEENIIYIKSDNDINYENILGITNKTIKSLNYLINKQKKVYDYVIRSNISTIINYNNLLSFLNTIPNNNIYTGGRLLNLQWLDLISGINKINVKKYKLFGLKYIQGISIILSFDVITKILENSNKLKYFIVDDVSIGLFIRYNIPIVYKNIKKYCNALVSYNYNEKSVFIRLKTLDRMNDVKNMLDITNKILNK